MSKKNVEVKAHYIKCDNESCHYVTEITMPEAKHWIDRPCPKCGHNLLTKDDYMHMLIFLGLVDIENSKPYKDNGKPDKSVLLNLHNGKANVTPKH